MILISILKFRKAISLLSSVFFSGKGFFILTVLLLELLVR